MAAHVNQVCWVVIIILGPIVSEYELGFESWDYNSQLDETERKKKEQNKLIRSRQVFTFTLEM